MSRDESPGDPVWSETLERARAPDDRGSAGGIRLDAARNQEMVGREGLISSDDSKLLVYAIPTDEELLIARDTVRVIKGEPHPS